MGRVVASIMRSRMRGGRLKRSKRVVLPKDYHKCAKLTDFKGFERSKRVIRSSMISACVPDGYEESEYERKVRSGK